MTEHRAPHLAAFTGWYANLDPASLEAIAEYYTENVRFRDPFHDVRGRETLYRIYRNMFTRLEGPRFEITGTVAEGDTAAVYWDFGFRYRGRAITIKGSSWVRFAADGRVEAHVDYWDAASQVYARIPLLGAVLERLRRRLAAAMVEGTGD